MVSPAPQRERENPSSFFSNNNCLYDARKRSYDNLAKEY